MRILLVTTVLIISHFPKLQAASETCPKGQTSSVKQHYYKIQRLPVDDGYFEDIVDLNSNGRKDKIVHLKSSCGYSGCEFKVYLNQDDKCFKPSVDLVGFYKLEFSNEAKDQPAKILMTVKDTAVGAKINREYIYNKSEEIYESK